MPSEGTSDTSRYSSLIGETMLTRDQSPHTCHNGSDTMASLFYANFRLPLQRGFVLGFDARG